MKDNRITINLEKSDLDYIVEQLRIRSKQLSKQREYDEYYRIGALTANVIQQMVRNEKTGPTAG